VRAHWKWGMSGGHYPACGDRLLFRAKAMTRSVQMHGLSPAVDIKLTGHLFQGSAIRARAVLGHGRGFLAAVDLAALGKSGNAGIEPTDGLSSARAPAPIARFPPLKGIIESIVFRGSSRGVSGKNTHFRAGTDGTNRTYRTDRAYGRKAPPQRPRHRRACFLSHLSFVI
jgi:hypothetical protein